jgi:UDP-N-acetylmuramoyl-tripeptide--D-alanyl-D-alanine ligase
MTTLLATAAQVAEATKGALVRGGPDTACLRVSTDSRVPVPDSIFFALKGENFDGSHFCAEAVAAGARILVVQKPAWDAHLQADLARLGEAAVVQVEDTTVALGELAAWHRSRFEIRVVGITGSNGKTSTKEMAASVLGGAPSVLFTRGNFNNQVGMPRALLSLGSGHRHAVLEMGMNTPGEITALAGIARPQVGVITNVHPVHLEGLGSIDAVARAKGELFEALPGSGTAVVNADDPYVLKQKSRTSAGIVTFGRDPTADVRVVAARHREGVLEAELSLQQSGFTVRLGRPGLHNALNAAAAAAVGMIEGIPVERIAERLAAAPLPALRMEQLRLGPGLVLVDCYNANPRSVQAAMHTLKELSGEQEAFAILGDMRELGDAEEELHIRTGQAAAKQGLAGLCAFGEVSVAIARGARDAGMTDVYETSSVAEATGWAAERIKPGGAVLIKGSRAMRMERIVGELAGSFGVAWPAEKEKE